MTALTHKWVAYGISKTLIINGDATTPTLKALASAGQKCGNEIDNTTALYMNIDWELYVRGASAFTAGTTVDLYLVPAIDGTNYTDGADDSTAPPSSTYHCSFPLRAVSTQQRISVTGRMIGPGKYKPVVINNGGQAFTNTDNENILYYRTYYDQAV